jgi:hypothetical protein
MVTYRLARIAARCAGRLEGVGWAGASPIAVLRHIAFTRVGSAEGRYRLMVGEACTRTITSVRIVTHGVVRITAGCARRLEGVIRAEAGTVAILWHVTLACVHPAEGGDGFGVGEACTRTVTSVRIVAYGVGRITTGYTAWLEIVQARAGAIAAIRLVAFRFTGVAAGRPDRPERPRRRRKGRIAFLAFVPRVLLFIGVADVIDQAVSGNHLVFAGVCILIARIRGAEQGVGAITGVATSAHAG